MRLGLTTAAASADERRRAPASGALAGGLCLGTCTDDSDDTVCNLALDFTAAVTFQQSLGRLILSVAMHHVSRWSRRK